MIDYNVSVRADFDDLRKLSPEQCDAFLRGVAKVLSANPYRSEPQAESESDKPTNDIAADAL